MERSQQNAWQTAGTRGERNWLEAREAGSSVSETLSGMKEGAWRRETRPPNERKVKAGSWEVGVSGRMALQTKVAVEGAVSVWIQKEALKAKKNE